jgi:sigma-B regulation protein RsbU (phosphoserine phosphatase)
LVFLKKAVFLQQQFEKRHMENVRLSRNLTLPNDINSIPQLNEYIDSVCEDMGLDMATSMSLNLALEEAVVNVMNYAYPEGTKGTVNIETIADNTQITFIISDSGKFFDPTAKEEVDTTLSAEERPIGGLGIHLIRQIMNHVVYERKDDKNILKLTKNISSK